MKLSECIVGLSVRDKLDGEVGWITRVDDRAGIVYVGQLVSNGSVGECDFDPLDLEPVEE